MAINGTEEEKTRFKLSKQLFFQTTNHTVFLIFYSYAIDPKPQPNFYRSIYDALKATTAQFTFSP